MRCTARAAMSAGPTTRRIGSTARSWLRRASKSSPSTDADRGVSTKPAAMRWTRTGASSSAKLAVRAGRHGSSERWSRRQTTASAPDLGGAGCTHGLAAVTPLRRQGTVGRAQSHVSTSSNVEPVSMIRGFVAPVWVPSWLSRRGRLARRPDLLAKCFEGSDVNLREGGEGLDGVPQHLERHAGSDGQRGLL
jgi:hypothetical protein